MIIDAHTHLGQLGSATATAQTLLESMDESHIDYSIVIANKYGDSPMGTSSEEIIRICKENPRLKAVANINFSQLDENQIAFLTEALEAHAISGIKLGPGYEDYYPTDEKLNAIYSLCQKLHKPVIFHTGVLASYRKGFLKQSHPLNIDEVATKYPDLKIVMAHLGNPWFIDCAAVVYRHENVYTDVSAFFDEFKTIKPTSYPNFANQLLIFKKYLGNYKKLLFGTDYPLYSQNEYLDAVMNSIELTEEEKELVLWKNAASIFNLQLE
jgi:predicted TIM-barrel fold metal-dependent hydrolase